MGGIAKYMNTIQFDRYKAVPIDKLVKAAWNYKTDDPALLEKLKANIKRNGQVENLLVRQLPTGFYEVVNGNHRYDALVQLEATEAVVFDLGTISDAQARRIAVETNETKFDTDNIRLAELIKEIRVEFDADELAESMPYSEEELENFTKLLEFDWGQYGSSAADGDDTPPDSGEDGGQFAFKFSSDEERQFWCDRLGIDGSLESYTVKDWKRLHPEE